MPIVEGASYEIQAGAKAKPVRVAMHAVPETVTETIALVAWMADRGCRRQAMVLIKGLN
ncbi:hypothetical protein WCLP8_2770009 [uncultured Gammaproteobacteria bacterium]